VHEHLSLGNRSSNFKSIFIQKFYSQNFYAFKIYVSKNQKKRNRAMKAVKGVVCHIPVPISANAAKMNDVLLMLFEIENIKKRFF